MFGAKSGRAARQNFAVFRGILFKTLDVLVIDMVDMTLAILANALFGGAAGTTYLVVTVVGFLYCFIFLKYRKIHKYF